jgi:flagellar protein FliO/FliZ
MFDNLFGAEMPLAVRFFLAFLIVLGLIGVTAWAVRRFGTGRLGGGAARGRQPRLAVIDYASVDGRRRLILVRRDNVEHLLMIGGPTDIVVEPNIVRAVAAPRDIAARPPAAVEVLPRAIPLPENGNGHGAGSWPLQPEPAAAARPAPRLEPLPDETPRAFPLAAESRPQRDTLAALADELSARSAPSRNRPAAARAAEDEPVGETQSEPETEPRPEPREPIQETRQESRPEPRREPRHEPRVELPRKPIAAPAPPPAAPVPPAPPIAPAPAAEAAAAPDQSLADMAQRLEAALRKPMTEGRGQPAAARTAPAAEQPVAADHATRRMPRPPEGKPQRSETKPSQGKTTLYDNLEQEMASLLGRPASKT